MQLMRKVNSSGTFVPIDWKALTAGALVLQLVFTAKVTSLRDYC